jgi:predicted nucleic acid-binding protein
MIAAILDTNLLFSAPVRDFYLNIADLGIYRPKWSSKILEELIKSITSKRKDINVKKIDYVISQMNLAFPDAQIFNYQTLNDNIKLPDKNDHHVLAAAIYAKVDWIVTFNVKDFPYDSIRKFNISVTHPDDFIVMLIEQYEKQIIIALNNKAKSLKNSPLSYDVVLSNLKKCGLKKSVNHLIEIL